MQKYFFIKLDGRYLKINFSEINFVEGARNYLKIVTEKRNYLVLMSMKKMEKLLPLNLFVRIHKSYIVSLDHITEFDKESVYLKDKSLPIGNQFKGAVERSVMIAQDDQMSQLLTLPIDYLRQKAYAG